MLLIICNKFELSAYKEREMVGIFSFTDFIQIERQTKYRELARITTTQLLMKLKNIFNLWGLP